MHTIFRAALAATLAHEGTCSADQYDPGGQTFMGISRIYWPNWPGWIWVDNWQANGGPVPDLTSQVEEFYFDNFWTRLQGDVIAAIAQAIACELFDTAVNLGVTAAVTFLQTALNMQNRTGEIFPDLQPDGRPGPVTIATLKKYLDYQPRLKEKNTAILLSCMNGEQYIAYKNNPKHEYFRGWFARV